jgi:hypothetical protein
VGLSPGFLSRFFYAVGTAFVAKGDNGHWQPDYSDMIGGFAARDSLESSLPNPAMHGARASKERRME